MGRLDARADAEGRHPTDVVTGGELDVLDAAAGAGLLEGRQRLGDGPVADGVHGHLDTTRHGARKQAPKLLGGLVGLPLLRTRNRLLGVGVAAPGGPRVERTVADDLERSHRQAPPSLGQGAVERVTGAQATRQNVVDAVGIAGVTDADEVRALGPPRHPVRDAAAELEVHEPDHAERGSGLHRAAVGVRSGAVGANHGREPAVGHEPLGLADHAVAGRQRQHVQRRRVEPAVVPVAGDEHDGLVGLDRVEVRDGRVVLPRRGSVAPPDHRQVRPLGEPLPDRRDRIGARAGSGQVEARGRQGPLGEVDVLVPQTRHQPAAARVVGRLAPASLQPGADLGDHPVGDPHVDEARDGIGQGHEPGVADEHAPTVGGGLATAPRAAPRPRARGGTGRDGTGADSHGRINVEE